MLNLQIVSDIHVEFWAEKKKFNFLKPSAPNLLLLGDICCCGSDSDFELFKKFINEILPLYKIIIFVPGNHEYYYNAQKPTAPKTIDEIDARIKSFFKETSDNLYFLNNNSLKINVGKTTYLIAGTTLWTWIPEDRRKNITSEMNDYSYIYTADAKGNPRLITAEDVCNMHLKSVRYIKSQVVKAKKQGYKLIMLTHHKPYLSNNFDPATNMIAYECDMSTLFLPHIPLWAYGHTHVADNTIKNKTLLYSNPKGYPSQKTKFNKAAIVTV